VLGFPARRHPLLGHEGVTFASVGNELSMAEAPGIGLLGI